jgi:diaminopimelate decarboxylase/aspartate kinase
MAYRSEHGVLATSDTSGSYMASLVMAKRLEIWTDVPGMFTANPRMVPGARMICSLSYDEGEFYK